MAEYFTFGKLSRLTTHPSDSGGEDTDSGEDMKEGLVRLEGGTGW